jgi:hypothetical protein
MPRFDPYESLGFHCNMTFKAFFGALEENLRGTGVSPAQFVALAQLIACGPLSQAELVSRLSITPATKKTAASSSWCLRKRRQKYGTRFLMWAIKSSRKRIKEWRLKILKLSSAFFNKFEII